MVATDRIRGLVSSVAIKAPCRLATTANITLNGLQSIDGVTTVSGDRVLVKDQTTASENGIYVADTGDWTRPPDFDGTGDFVQGTIIAVISGTLYNGTVWQLTTASPAIGSSLAFSIMGTGALSGVSTFMQTVLPALSAPAARTTLGAAGLTGNESIAGNKTFTGATDMTGGTLAVPTKTAGTNTTDAASTAFVKTKAESVVGGTALRSYLAGLGTSNNSGTPNTKIDVAAGVCADDTNALMLSLAATTLDCGTTGANGLDTGSLANATWYHLFVIGKTDGTTALLASTSISSPTFLSGYTLKRRIASFKTDGSAHILAFSQNGDEFMWATPINNINDTSVAFPTTLTLQTLTVPTGLQITAVFGAAMGAGSPLQIAYSSPAQTGASAPATLPNGAANSGFGAARYAILTNTSGQIQWIASGAGSTQTRIMATYGWIDRRGRDA